MQPDEVSGPAGLLGLSEEEFTRTYTEPRHGVLSIKTDLDGFCLFHDRETHFCLIHGSKPRMCRDWPFFYGPLASRQGFEDAKNACPGINPEATWEDFVECHRRLGGEMPPRTYIPCLIAGRGNSDSKD